MADKDAQRCMTPEFRASFAHVFKPHSFEGQEAKYQVTMLFPKKSADLTPLKRARVAALTDRFGPDKAKWPKNMRNPFRDGDEKPDLQGYEGHIFVAARSKQRPGLVNKKREPIIDESEFYSGCYGRCTLYAYYYDHMGNKGVAFGLQNIQKLRDGEAFSGRKKAEDDFDAVDVGDDDDPLDFNNDSSVAHDSDDGLGF